MGHPVKRACVPVQSSKTEISKEKVFLLSLSFSPWISGQDNNKRWEGRFLLLPSPSLSPSSSSPQRQDDDHRKTARGILRPKARGAGREGEGEGRGVLPLAASMLTGHQFLLLSLLRRRAWKHRSFFSSLGKKKFLSFPAQSVSQSSSWRRSFCRHTTYFT